MLLEFLTYLEKMRVGTQTLIQALQALSWTEPDNSDEVSDHSNAADSDSEEEGR